MASTVSKTEIQNEKPVKKNWEFERQRDNRIVRGKFLYHELPGGTLSFNYQMVKHSIKDGEIIDLPFGVAKHLNNIGKPIHQFAKDENGKTLMKISSFVKRCSFQSLDFLGEDNFNTPSLFTVERVTDLVK